MTSKRKVFFFTKEKTLFFFCVISILPFLIISIFNNPAADDFSYYCKSRDLGFLNAQYDWYNYWSGRYFSTAILSTQILQFESFLLYKLIPILLLIGLLFSTYLLIAQVFKNLIKKDVILFSSLFSILYLIQIPSISQGLYWLSGAITYQLPNILSILFLLFFIKLLENNKIKYVFILIALSCFIIGSNETSMLFLDFYLMIVFIYKYVSHKKINYSVLILLLFALLFSLIVYKAPGNEVRSNIFINNHQFFYSAYKSAILTTAFIAYWLPITLLFVYIFPQYFLKSTQFPYSKLFNVNPIFVACIIISSTFLGFFAGYWSLGKHSPLRAINTIYLYFLLGTIYLAFVLSFYLRKKNIVTALPSKWLKLLLFIIFITACFQKNNIVNAYSDLLSGKAYNYNLELKDRYKAITKSSNDVIYVDKLENLPTTLFFEDITNDPQDWINTTYSCYFGKKSIILKDK